MGDLFGTLPVGSVSGTSRKEQGASLNDKRDAVKAHVGMTEVADWLGLGGHITGEPNGARMARGNSVVACLDCPACKVPGGLRVREDDEGGRCTNCDTGFDVFDLAMKATGKRFSVVLEFLHEKLTHRLAQDAKPDVPKLF